MPGNEAYFLEYNKDNIFKGLIQAETHLRHAKPGQQDEGLNCVVKHLAEIEGEADEAVSHSLVVEGEEVANKFRELRDQVRQLRKEFQKGKITPEEGIRRLRRIRGFFESFNPEYDISKCDTCGASEEVLKAFFQKASPVVGAGLQRSALGLVKYLAARYNVPVPKVVFQPCPGVGGACYMYPVASSSKDGEEDLGVIYLDPKTFNPHQICHEFAHYLHRVRGEEDSEEKANEFADRMMKELFPEGFKYSELKMHKNDYSVKQYRGGMFEKLDEMYKPIGDLFKIPASDLNRAFTPEVLGTITEMIVDAVFTPLGSALIDLLTSLGLTFAAGSVTGISDTDRKFLVEMAGHLGTRWIKLLSPAALGSTMSAARSLGASLAKLDVNGIKNALIKSPAAIAAAFKLPRFAPPAPAPTPAPTPPPTPPAPPAAPAPAPTATMAPKYSLDEKLVAVPEKPMVPRLTAKYTLETP